MNLYLVTLVSIFGHSARQPLRAALLKVGAMVAASLIAGYAVGQSVPPFPAMKGLIWAHFLLEITFAVQLAVLIVILSASGALSRSSRLSLVLASLPLRDSQRGRLLFIPSLVLITCALFLITPGIVSLAPNKIQMLPIIAAVLFGTFAAIGLAYPPRRRYIYRLTAFLVILAEYKALQFSQRPDAGLMLLIILLVFVFSAFKSKNVYSNIALTSSHIPMIKNIKLANLPFWLWMAKKIWRNRAVQMNFLVTFSLACGLAYIGHRMPAIMASYVGLLGQMLAATFGSDLRSTSQRLNPPEIHSLKGSSYFTASLGCVGVVTALLGTAPLVALSFIDHTGPALLIMQLVAGAVVGLAVGFWLVPASHDISAQLSATLACLALTLLPSRLAIGNEHPALLYLLITMAALSFIFIVEYKRNSYKWRPYAHKEI